MSESLIEKFIEEMHVNPVLRDKFIQELFKDEIIRIQWQVLDEIKKLREESNKRFEENDKRIAELINTMNKGFENVNKRFENVNKRFEENDKRIAELINTMNKRFEENERSITKNTEALLKQVNEIHELMKAVKHMSNRIHRQDETLKGIGGMNLELQDLMFFRAIVHAKGYDAKRLEWRKTFRDPEKISGMDEVELDLFQEDPLVIGEVTSYVLDIKKVTKFLKKLKFVKKKFKKKPYALFITYGFHPDIAESAKDLLEANDIVLIAAGENRDAVLDLDWEYFNLLEE